MWWPLVAGVSGEAARTVLGGSVAGRLNRPSDLLHEAPPLAVEIRQKLSSAHYGKAAAVTSLAQQVLTHAASLPEGTRLSAKVLLHLGSRAQKDQALSWLARSGELLRAGRAV